MRWSRGFKYWPIVRIWTPCARRSSIVAATSSNVSPSPTINPDFVFAVP
jgi:hypothetical protein